MKWKTKEGQEKDVSELDDNHLLNILRMMERNWAQIVANQMRTRLDAILTTLDGIKNTRTLSTVISTINNHREHWIDVSRGQRSDYYDICQEAIKRGLKPKMYPTKIISNMIFYDIVDVSKTKWIQDRFRPSPWTIIVSRKNIKERGHDIQWEDIQYVGEIAKADNTMTIETIKEEYLWIPIGIDIVQQQPELDVLLRDASFELAAKEKHSIGYILDKLVNEIANMNGTESDKHLMNIEMKSGIGICSKSLNIKILWLYTILREIGEI